jgi:hypothetical protein
MRSIRADAEVLEQAVAYLAGAELEAAEGMLK